MAKKQGIKEIELQPQPAVNDIPQPPQEWSKEWGLESETESGYTTPVKTHAIERCGTHSKHWHESDRGGK